MVRVMKVWFWFIGLIFVAGGIGSITIQAHGCVVFGSLILIYVILEKWVSDER